MTTDDEIEVSIRLPARLHHVLGAVAKADGHSLDDEIVERLFETFSFVRVRDRFEFSLWKAFNAERAALSEEASGESEQREPINLTIRGSGGVDVEALAGQLAESMEKST